MRNKWLLILAVVVLSGCGEHYVPKPYGYFRIALPEHDYQTVSPDQCPVSFDISKAAFVQRKGNEEGWFDIVYPTLDTRIHCNYKPVKGNLRELGDDAQEFVFKHAGMASSIPEQGYEDDERRVYGVYYELRGNTASPYQFYLTDSTHHFFRGAVYFNSVPNQDSLAPVANFLSEDVKHLIESVAWK